MGIIRKKSAISKEAFKRGFDPRFWIYRLRWNWYPKFCIAPKMPSHLDIELTNACNLRCVMCVHGQSGVKNQGFMEVSLAKYLIDQAAEIGIASIKFNWRGEATLHKSLAELILYAKKKGIIEVQLNTNGTLMDEKLIGDLIMSGLDRIIFSLDAATKEIYEKIRIGAKFEKVIDAVVRLFKMRLELKRRKPFIRIQMVKLKNNEHETSAFIKRWSSFTDEIRISEATDRGQGGELLVGDRVAAGRVRCTQPWQRMAVSWEGKVYPCCADYYGKWIIGDARKEKLIDIWKGPRIELMRCEQKKLNLSNIESCKSCFWSGSYKWKEIAKKKDNV